MLIPASRHSPPRTEGAQARTHPRGQEHCRGTGLARPWGPGGTQTGQAPPSSAPCPSEPPRPAQSMCESVLLTREEELPSSLPREPGLCPPQHPGRGGRRRGRRPQIRVPPEKSPQQPQSLWGDVFAPPSAGSPQSRWYLEGG